MAVIGDNKTDYERASALFKELGNALEDMAKETDFYSAKFGEAHALVDQLTDMLDGMAGAGTFASTSDLLRDAKAWLAEVKAFFG